MTGGKLPAEFFAGERVRIEGVLGPPRLPVAKGLFDYRRHLALQGIYFQIRAKSASEWTVLSSNRPPFTDRFIAWAKRTMELGLPEEDEELRLNWAMMLGWKTALTNEVSTPFMRSGTMHIFAISGLHIAFIAGILVSVLRVLQLPRFACGLLVIPLIWFYTAATGWQSSAIRSTVMMTVVLGGWALRRPSDMINSLATAALVILIWQPQQLFQPSFQLSFFVVLSMALFVPPLEEARNQMLAPDPLLPAQAVPPWRRLLNTPAYWVLTPLATSVGAWLGSLPLTAYYFHLFSPVTLLANMVVVPLSTLALASALGSLTCGAWCPWLVEVFNHSAWLWMNWMVGVSEWATTLPGAYRYVPAPPPWLFVCYYAVLISALSSKWFAKHWKLKWGTVLACVVATMIVLAGWLPGAARYHITVLPLNSGHAVYADAPGRANDALIDCGASNAVRFVTLPVLRAQGVNHLPRLALTHGDLQDIGGTGLLRAENPTAEHYTGPANFRSPVYRQIMRTLETNQAVRKIVTAGEAFAGWEVLHPAMEDTFRLADDASLVLLGRFHATRILLLSDLGRPGQDALLLRTNDLSADIVVTGLPEQTEPLSEALLERVQPKLIVVADSEYPARARARPELRERLTASKAQVLYTREVGAVEITIQRGQWRYEVARRSESGISNR
jgi:ComEC/Rec2-related protein